MRLLDRIHSLHYVKSAVGAGPLAHPLPPPDWLRHGLQHEAIQPQQRKEFQRRGSAEWEFDLFAGTRCKTTNGISKKLTNHGYSP